MRTRLVSYKPFGASTGPLPDALEAQIVTPLGDLSTAEVHYPRQGVKAAALDGLVEVGFEVLDEAGVWVEAPNCRFLSMKGGFDHLEQTPTRKYSLVSVGWMLRGARVWEPAGLPVDVDGKVQFLSANAGKIMGTLIANAKARGWGSGLSVDFSATKTSDGKAWGKIVTIAYDLDIDLDTVLSNLYQQGVCDYRWEGRTLRIFNPDTAMGRDLTAGANPTRLIVADGQTAAPEEWTNEDLLSHLAVLGEGGARWEFDGAGTGPLGRLEKVTAQGGVSDAGTAQLLAEPDLLRGEDTRVSYTREFVVTDAMVKAPYRDYLPGDWVLAQRGTGFERLRTMSLSLTVDADGVKGHAVLGDRLEDLLMKLAKKTKGISGGAAVGGSGVRPSPEGPDKRHPVAPTGLVAAADVYVDGDGAAQGQVGLSWAHSGKATDGTAMDVDRYQVQYRVNVTGELWKSLLSTGDKSATYSPLPLYKSDGVTAEAYAFRVRATGSNALASAWSGVAAVSMVKDTTPPPVPYFAAADLSTWLRTVTAKWGGKGTTDGTNQVPMPRDFDHVNVYRASSASMAGAVLVGAMRDVSSWTSDGEQSTVTSYYALTSVDRSGNESAMSAARSVTPSATVDISKITDKIDAANVTITNAHEIALGSGVLLGAKLDASDSALSAAADRLDLAEADITDAFGQITAVDGKASAAASAASTAQSKADTAKSAANSAAADALAAAGLAGSKGEIIYQISAPTGSRANTANLWIRSSDDKPHTYDTGTSKWVARTDKAALDAATAAASAASAAAAAQSTASAAQTAAGTAGTNATAALTMAGSKSKVYYSTAVATGTGTAAGDLWRQRNASNEVIAEWQWSGSAWIKQTVSGSNVSNMDIGFLTAGAATMSQALINKLVAGTANFQTVDVKNLFVTTGTMSEAVINKLWADVVMSRKITTQMLAVGSFDNLIAEPDFTNGGASWRLASTRQIITGQARNGGPVFRMTATGVINSAYNSPSEIPVSGETSWRITAWVRSSVAVAENVYTIFARARSSSGSFTYPALTPVTPALTAGQWTKITGVVTAPESTVTASFALSLRASFPAGATLDFDFVSATRMNAGELTVDGTVTANALATNSVTAAKIDSLAVTTDKLAANAVTADKANIGSLRAGILTADVIKGSMITGDAIDGKTITGATIRTAATGARVEQAGSRLSVYDAANKQQVNLGALTTGGHGLEVRNPVTNTLVPLADHVFGIGSSFSAGPGTLSQAGGTTGSWNQIGSRQPVTTKTGRILLMCSISLALTGFSGGTAYRALGAIQAVLWTASTGGSVFGGNFINMNLTGSAISGQNPAPGDNALSSMVLLNGNPGTYWMSISYRVFPGAGTFGGASLTYKDATVVAIPM